VPRPHVCGRDLCLSGRMISKWREKRKVEGMLTGNRVSMGVGSFVLGSGMREDVGLSKPAYRSLWARPGPAQARERG
jgi:hypothetical protein